MKRTLTLLALCLAFGTMMSFAQKKNIVLHYDFKKSVGTTVRDISRNHVDAQLMNGAKVERGNLVLADQDAYLDMTARAGEVMSQLSDFSIAVRYYIEPDARVRGNGYFLWCFSCLEANKEKDGPYHAYRINQQRVETSIGGWSQETGIMVDKVSDKGRWITVIFRQKEGIGELFIDGRLIGTERGFALPTRNFATAPAYNWIGRAPFAGDNYLSHAMVSDFRVYDISISDKEVAKLSR